MLQTLTPPDELAVPATPDVIPIYPPLPLPSMSVQPQFLTLTIRTIPPYRDQLENPVLVPGAQGFGLVLPSKIRQGTQFWPGDTPGAE